MAVFRRLAIALSLANACFLSAWSALLTYSDGDAFFMRTPPAPGQYAGLMASVVLLGLILFLATTVMRWKRGKIAAAGQWIFLLAVFIPLNGLREVASNRNRLLRADLFRFASPTVVLLFLVAISVVLLFILARYQQVAVRLLAGLFLMTSPFVLVTFGQGIYRMTHFGPERFTPHALAGPIPHPKASPRIVVLLFDEWDYRLTFVDRKSGLALPELDRLRRESLFATAAVTPNTTTLVSVPSILTGKFIDGSWPAGTSQLMVHVQGDPSNTDFAQFPNLFTMARDAGYNTAAVGWYLPYCRLFSGELTTCDSHQMAMQFNSTGSTFTENLVNQPRSLFETSLFSIFGQSLVIQHRIDTYLREMRELRADLDNPSLGFLYAHMGIPHPPYFYNRRTGRFDLRNSAVAGYLDNIALVDRTIGDIRRQMEAASDWDSSVVLITSDHSFRTSAAIDGKKDRRVPFLLKMPGPPAGGDFDLPFNTLLIYRLMDEIVHGSVTTVADAAASITAKAPEQSSALRR